MALKAYRFVGLDKDVWLPDDIQVIIDIVPTTYCGWVRSCNPVAFSEIDWSTFHDTGTPGATARSQRNYLHSGPRNADDSKRLVGFNFAVDDKVIYQLTPLNEVTWAAGTPKGNRQSWHVEQCFGGTINWDMSLRNAQMLHAGLIQAIGDPVDTTLVKHQYWYGKWCPGQILNKGIWPSVVVAVSKQVAAINAHLAGGGSGGGGAEPVYAPADPIEELLADKNSNTAPAFIDVNGTRWTAVFDRVEVTKETPRLQYGSADSKHVGPPLKVGESFDVTHIASANDPVVYHTPYGTRVLVADTKRKNDTQGEPNAEGGE